MRCGAFPEGAAILHGAEPGALLPLLLVPQDLRCLHDASRDIKRQTQGETPNPRCPPAPPTLQPPQSRAPRSLGPSPGALPAGSAPPPVGGAGRRAGGREAARAARHVAPVPQRPARQPPQPPRLLRCGHRGRARWGPGLRPAGRRGPGRCGGEGSEAGEGGGTAATWPPRALRAASRPALPGRGAAALSGTPGGGTRPRGAPRPGRAAPGGAAGGCGPARPRGRHLLPAGLAAAAGGGVGVGVGRGGRGDGVGIKNSSEGWRGCAWRRGFAEHALARCCLQSTVVPL